MADLTPDQFRSLWERTEAWRMEGSGDFHSDRQLADELLILDGWQVEPDAGFEGGFRWFWGSFSSSESTRPHPLHDLNAATGLVPFGMNWSLEHAGPISAALIWKGDNRVVGAAGGKSGSPAAAICAAFVKWKWMQKGAQNG